jgi:hypothetical protein|eukprot:773533-Prymnesium_polylepis.1
MSGRKLVGIRGLARLARLGVWHVWPCGWTPGRAWTSYARGTGTLGVFQRLAASGRLDVWTSGTPGQRLANVWQTSGSRLAGAQIVASDATSVAARHRYAEEGL